EPNPSGIRVLQDDGRTLPFTLHNKTLRFFSGSPGIVRVSAADREFVYSLALPEMAEARWEPPKDARRGVPSSRDNPATPIDLWQLLACLGAAGLALDWALYGKLGRYAARPVSRAPSEEGSSLPQRLRRFAGRGRA